MDSEIITSMKTTREMPTTTTTPTSTTAATKLATSGCRFDNIDTLKKQIQIENLNSNHHHHHQHHHHRHHHHRVDEMIATDNSHLSSTPPPPPPPPPLYSTNNNNNNNTNNNHNNNSNSNNNLLNQPLKQHHHIHQNQVAITKNEVKTTRSESAEGCVHYKRRAKFITPCCNKFYKCRYCHDENEDHHFDRKTLTELICSHCDTRQKVQAECENCGVRFGKYTCLICNLFDDEDKDQYHCHGCGICRLGGRDNFFHCEVCNMCLPVHLKTDGHKCVENISRSNCPVCLGDIHTSRIPCHIPDCGHLLHKTCFDQLLASGHYVCPTCQTSMIDMKKLWDYLDAQAINIPVPKSYQNSNVNIFCNDCYKQSTVKFHFVGLKCGNCGGYNTSQNMKKRTWTHLSNSKDNPSTSA